MTDVTNNVPLGKISMNSIGLNPYREVHWAKRGICVFILAKNWVTYSSNSHPLVPPSSEKMTLLNF